MDKASRAIVIGWLVLCVGLGRSQDLYDPCTLRTISLRFSQPDWWSRLVANYQSKTNLTATLICEDQVYEGVGVRFRGNTSYQMTGNSQKKSFNIEIDYTIPGQRLMGYKTLNLLNCANDPTFMREVLYTNVCRRQIPSAKANFVRLEINGQDWGIYANIQQLNGDFIRDWFPSNEGTRWRAEGRMGPVQGNRPTQPTGGTGGPVIQRMEPLVAEIGAGGGVTNGVAALTWQGTSSTAYQAVYELKGTHQLDPWASLIHTCYVLNNTPLAGLPNVLGTVLDVDRALWVCAFEIVFQDDDGYVYKRGSDYCLYYEPETGRIHLIQYDGNESFYGSPTAWPLFFRADDPLVPLMYRLMAINEYRQRYLAHVRTILEEHFTEDGLIPTIEAYRSLIEPYVKTDTKKLYTYQQFVSGIDQLKTFVRQRRAYLLSDRELAQQPPVILGIWTDVKNKDTAPLLTIKAMVSRDVPVARVDLFIAPGPFAIFERIPMSHAGDGPDGQCDLFAATLPTFPAGTVLRYYVQAVAANPAQTVAFSPPGAEYHCYRYIYNYAQGPRSEVVINELMADNASTVADPQGQFDDWIELANISDEPVDISGMYLSDDPARPLKWRIPDGTVLGPAKYLLIWADEDGQDCPGLHANFKLSSSGEAVWLFDSAQNGHRLLDYAPFGSMGWDQSIGRVPDGQGLFELLTVPTPGSANMR
ncbi:MAG: CotH kinase family protein [Sedimentisphaerales bacterium]|nr:CotH kinase family protein [Sedimentisphaerales bacterium]